MNQVKSAGMMKTFAPGEYIFHEGDGSHAMYLIQKGTVAIRKTKGQQFIEIARLYSNEVLGEVSFFDRQPRSASAVALTDVEAMELRFDALDKVYGLVPDYLKAIMVSVADRLRKADETIRRLQRDAMKETGGAENESKPESAEKPASAETPEKPEQK